MVDLDKFPPQARSSLELYDIMREERGDSHGLMHPVIGSLARMAILSPEASGDHANQKRYRDVDFIDLEDGALDCKLYIVQSDGTPYAEIDGSTTTMFRRTNTDEIGIYAENNTQVGTFPFDEELIQRCNGLPILTPYILAAFEDYRKRTDSPTYRTKHPEQVQELQEYKKVTPPTSYEKLVCEALESAIPEASSNLRLERSLHRAVALLIGQETIEALRKSKALRTCYRAVAPKRKRSQEMTKEEFLEYIKTLA